MPIIALLPDTAITLPMSEATAPTNERDERRKMERVFPPEARRAGISGTSYVEFRISPDGQIYDCRVRQTTGSAEFGPVACELLMQSKFKPATLNGQPITGVFTEVRKFFVTSPIRGRPNVDFIFPPDMEFSVVDLPGTDEDKIYLSLLLAVAANGDVQGCQLAADGVHKSLVEYACQQTQDWGHQVRDRDGTPVPYVMSIIVRFVEQVEQ